MLITGSAVFKAKQSSLKLRRPFYDPQPDFSITSDSPHIISILNVSHPTPVMILGPEELAYFQSCSEATLLIHFEYIKTRTKLLVVCEKSDESPILMNAAQTFGIALWFSVKHAVMVLKELKAFFQHLIHPPQTIHGVFMEVFDLGVLLTGPSGVGKSELALELINRGHRLIADDAPEFRLEATDWVIGTCPQLLRDFLEVRGLGILNIRDMFGDTAVKKQKRLQLIVHVMAIPKEEILSIDRIQGLHQSVNILGMVVPKVTIPVAAGRNLAVLVEGAVRHHMLKLNGSLAARQFANMQERVLIGEAL